MLASPCVPRDLFKASSYLKVKTKDSKYDLVTNRKSSASHSLFNLNLSMQIISKTTSHDQELTKWFPVNHSLLVQSVQLLMLFFKVSRVYNPFVLSVVFGQVQIKLTVSIRLCT